MAPETNATTKQHQKIWFETVTSKYVVISKVWISGNITKIKMYNYMRVVIINKPNLVRVE